MAKFQSDQIGQEMATIYNHEAIEAAIQNGDCYIVQDHTLKITYINGMKFANELLINLTHSLPIGELFAVIKRDDTVTIHIVSPIEIAPEMYEALKALIDEARGTDRFGDDSITEAIAAIRKVEGK